MEVELKILVLELVLELSVEVDQNEVLITRPPLLNLNIHLPLSNTAFFDLHSAELLDLGGIEVLIVIKNHIPRLIIRPPEHRLDHQKGVLGQALHVRIENLDDHLAQPLELPRVFHLVVVQQVLENEDVVHLEEDELRLEVAADPFQELGNSKIDRICVSVDSVALDEL
jgi:hypothetical protein